MGAIRDAFEAAIYDAYDQEARNVLRVSAAMST
jgi:hypothetical protein